MYEVELQKNTNKALDHYVVCYETKYGTKPLPFNSFDTTAIKDVLRSLGLIKTINLLTVYFTLRGTGFSKDGREDDWFERRGHDLETFKKHLNYLNSLSAHYNPNKTHWVVALTETGRPVVTYNKDALANQSWFKPVPWNKWIKQSHREKAQLKGDNDTLVNPLYIEWVKNWQKWEKEWQPYEGE